ncbi:sensory box/GGDEF/GAF/EAL domain protein [Marinobacter santoriniensis NKSG1]|uniref:diguanylate cyclase n=1 Tax=Marinobacter santoriniensis NKSG1 TaxID=1288826 RepID=M7CR46_9GAMM|nr:sensor domain-containing diguanylate cyclase [Marinobacter santoriniensis]EMP54565.1 sensory box/GGDEF/GAF/EAL domain protein [Marinobacter santoriniensis NKSG1]
MNDASGPADNAYLGQGEAARLRTILEGTRAGTWEWNVQTGDALFNERWAGIIGYTLDELQPLSFETWLTHTHPDDLVVSEKLLQSHFRGDTDYYECEARMRHKDGHWVWVRAYGRLVSRTPDGKPEWVSGTHIDISASKAYQEKLEALQTEQQRTIERLEKMASRIPGLVYQFEMGPDGTIRFPYASAGIERIYNVTPDQVREDATRIFDAIHPDDHAPVREAVEASRVSGEDWICEYRVIVDGEIRWVFGRARPDYRKDGRTVWYGSILDITAQKELEEKLRRIAVTDELTGSANRRQFMKLLSREFLRYQRNGPDYAVILFDFDWFKRVNDRFGHNAGDLVLKETTRILQGELRASDTLGRVGGEEFAILLPDSDLDSARQLAERLRQTIAQHRFKGMEETLHGTITCGVAVSDPEDDQSNTIMLRADKALYRGKSAGRNRVETFHSGDNAR